MRRIAILLLTLASLSLLPLTASAGHYVVKCYRPCHHCKKVCKKYWVHHHRGYHRDHHYYRHHR